MPGGLKHRPAAYLDCGGLTPLSFEALQEKSAIKPAHSKLFLA
jgi:hypothetical protein